MPDFLKNNKRFSIPAFIVFLMMLFGQRSDIVEPVIDPTPTVTATATAIETPTPTPSPTPVKYPEGFETPTSIVIVTP